MLNTKKLVSLAAFFIILPVILLSNINAQLTPTELPVIPVVGPAPDQEQFFIIDNIKNYTGYGEYTDNPEYSLFYNASLAFDGKENTWSFWSQYGKAGFKVDLDKPLQVPVCAAELIVLNPNNGAFRLGLGSQSFEGVLNTKQIFGMTGCITDVDEITLDVEAPSKWTTISEIKLYTNTTAPPPPPPECEPGYHWDQLLQKCVPDVVPPPVTNVTELYFNNTKAIMYMEDSQLIVALDPNSTKIEPNPTLPPTPIPNTPDPVSPVPPPTPPVDPDDEDEDEEDEDDDEDEEDTTEEQNSVLDRMKEWQNK